MQNIVNQHIRNGLDCCGLHPVTYSRFGNNPSNTLVTEILSYSTRFCFFAMWKNRECVLILNRLRPPCSFPVSTAFPDFTHVARHTFGTTITLANKVSLQNVSKMLGHTSTRMTEHYARVLDQTIMEDMENVDMRLAL